MPKLDLSAIRSRRPGRARSLLLVVAYLSLTLVAGAVVYSELRPYLVSGLSNAARIEALNSRGHAPGLSFASQRIVLDDCYAALQSLEARAAPDRVWSLLLDRCESVASAVVEAVPTHGYGWLIGALVSSLRGADDDVRARLSRSRSVAAQEGWLAVERLRVARLAGSEWGSGDAEDLGVVLEWLPRTIIVLEWYAADPTFRARVNSVLETKSSAVQRRFIDAVRGYLPQSSD